MPKRNIATVLLWSFIACLVVAGALSACTTAKMVWYNYGDPTDYKLFPARPIRTAPVPFRFQAAPDRHTIGDHIPVTTFSSDPFREAKQVTLHAFLREMQTGAFLIIKDDVIVMEKYFGTYAAQTLIPSFSMAKSFVSALIGIAIAEQHIRDVQQPITAYLPELRGKGFESITIEHLLQMTSGIRFSERYDTISDAGKLYYTSDIMQRIAALQIANPPGTTFHYKSIDTQLLRIILARATGKPLAEYLQEKLWRPLGMEFEASWSLDRADGLEKAFCCLNARARDFAKFGRLYLQGGNWNGRQIVPEAWVKRSTQLDTHDGSVWWYQYQWRLASKTAGDFFALGYKGQYIYVNPQRQMIMVKCSKGGPSNRFWRPFFQQLAAAIDTYLQKRDAPSAKEGMRT